MNTRALRTGIAVAAMAVAMYATGCKDKAVTTTPTVTDLEIANTIAATLGSSTNGLSSQTKSSVDIATTGSMGIANKGGGAVTQGTNQDTTVVLSGADTANGGVVTYNYTFSAHSLFHLTGGGTSPTFVKLNTTSADLTLTMKGTYGTPTVTGNDSMYTTWTIGNILGATPLTLNGSYHRLGAITGRAQGNSFSYDNTLVLSNVEITRLSKKIAGGTATVNIMGSLMNASGQTVGDYSFTGVVTFLGNEEARLVLTNNKTGASATFDIDMTKSSCMRRP